MAKWFDGSDTITLSVADAVALRVSSVPTLPGDSSTETISGSELSMLTESLTASPSSSPSKGMTVQTTASPDSRSSRVSTSLPFRVNLILSPAPCQGPSSILLLWKQSSLL